MPDWTRTLWGECERRSADPSLGLDSLPVLVGPTCRWYKGRGPRPLLREAHRCKLTGSEEIVLDAGHTYGHGDVTQFTVTFDQEVDVDGKMRLSLILVQP